MRKIILFLLVMTSIISCGPKRMKCYGKRCVETKEKQETISNSRKV
jgi:hypothetical protein